MNQTEPNRVEKINRSVNFNAPILEEIQKIADETDRSFNFVVNSLCEAAIREKKRLKAKNAGKKARKRS